MKYLMFFVAFWFIVALAWRSAEVSVKSTRLYQSLEQLILAPITVVGWIKIAVNAALKKFNSR